MTVFRKLFIINLSILGPSCSFYFLCKYLLLVNTTISNYSVMKKIYIIQHNLIFNFNFTFIFYFNFILNNSLLAVWGKYQVWEIHRSNWSNEDFALSLNPATLSFPAFFSFFSTSITLKLEIYYSRYWCLYSIFHPY